MNNESNNEKDKDCELDSSCFAELWNFCDIIGENITDMEKETARGLLQANADNYDGLVKDVYFYRSAEGLEEVVL